MSNVEIALFRDLATVQYGKATHRMAAMAVTPATEDKPYDFYVALTINNEMQEEVTVPVASLRKVASTINGMVELPETMYNRVWSCTGADPITHILKTTDPRGGQKLQFCWGTRPLVPKQTLTEPYPTNGAELALACGAKPLVTMEFATIVDLQVLVEAAIRVATVHAEFYCYNSPIPNF